MRFFSNFFKFAIFILLVFAAFIGVTAQNRIEKTLLSEAERLTGDEFSFKTKTKRGAKIYAVREPSAKMLAAIDKGLSDLFAVARKSGYRQNISFSDYTIFIAQADRQKNADRAYSPDIAVNAGQYAGSVYDKGGYIYAAGVVVALNPSAFAVAEHEKDFERAAEIVRYEGEHLVLYQNDRRLYQETADHSKGGGHPILR